VIIIEDLYKGFGSQTVLNGINMNIEDGENLCIIGGSGSGKSVLIKLVLGLLEMDSGKITIDQRETQKFRPSDWHDLFEEIGVVFQGAALFDSLTVWENVGLRLIEQHRYTLDHVTQIVKEAIKQVGLEEEVLEKYPSQLSGGMQKRVGIARAIIHQPRYLFYDEPTTGLDPVNSDIIDDLIRALATEDRTSIIITHDMQTVKKVATSVAMLKDGKILFHGDTQAFFQSSHPVIQTFLARTKA